MTGVGKREGLEKQKKQVEHLLLKRFTYNKTSISITKTTFLKL